MIALRISFRILIVDAQVDSRLIALDISQDMAEAESNSVIRLWGQFSPH